jgi:hypothetical protein
MAERDGIALRHRYANGLARARAAGRRVAPDQRALDANVAVRRLEADRYSGAHA